MTKNSKQLIWQKLDHPDRKKMMPPDIIMDLMKVKLGMTIADIGCGIGYFSIPMAKVVGEKGKVYALDLNPLMLEELEKRINKEELINIETVLSSENGFKLGKETINLGFTSTVHHELDDSVQFLKQCYCIIKPNGHMAILDWNTVEEEMGPPIHHRIAPELVSKQLIEVGFKNIQQHMVGESLYLIIGKK